MAQQGERPTPQYDALRAIQAVLSNRRIIQFSARLAQVIQNGFGDVWIKVEHGKVKWIITAISEPFENEKGE